MSDKYEFKVGGVVSLFKPFTVEKALVSEVSAKLVKIPYGRAGGSLRFRKEDGWGYGHGFRIADPKFYYDKLKKRIEEYERLGELTEDQFRHWHGISLKESKEELANWEKQNAR